MNLSQGFFSTPLTGHGGPRRILDASHIPPRANMRSAIGIRAFMNSGIHAGIISAASPDRRFACFTGTQKSHRNQGAESNEFIQLSLRIGLPGFPAGSLFGGRSAPPQTRFARAGSVGLHFCLFSDFKRLLLRVKNRLKHAAHGNSCLSRQYHTFVVFQGSRENR